MRFGKGRHRMTKPKARRTVGGAVPTQHPQNGRSDSRLLPPLLEIIASWSLEAGAGFFSAIPDRRQVEGLLYQLFTMNGLAWAS